MVSEKYTIDQFKDAWFKKDYSSMTKEDFVIVYSEYMDISGLFLSEDFEKQSHIYYLQQRINYVILFINLQRKFISHFGIPFTRDFDNMYDRYGHRLTWNNDIEDFEKQINKIESREDKNKSLLENEMKELDEFRKRNSSKNKDDEDESDEKLQENMFKFLSMIISLKKMNYEIKTSETTVLELALIIKKQLEDKNSQ